MVAMKGIEPANAGKTKMKSITVACTLLLALTAASASAHDASAHAPVVLAADTQTTACGHKGSIRELRQSIAIDTSTADPAPGPTALPRGTTVRLALANPGERRQLAVLGSTDELQKLEKQLGRSPDKHYVAPYLVYLEPGQSAQLIWHFTAVDSCRLQVYTRGAMEPWRPHVTHRFSMPAANTASPGLAPTEPQS